MPLIKCGYFPITIFNFLKYFDYTLFEFNFIPIFLKDQILDSYNPSREAFSDELENYGYYYNTIAINIFRKFIFWMLYFILLLPISLICRRLLGKDSDIMKYWPDKIFFSGTTMIFFS